MEKYDWSRFVTRILINASPQVLYDAWSSQKGIEHWFLRAYPNIVVVMEK